MEKHPFFCHYANGNPAKPLEFRKDLLWDVLMALQKVWIGSGIEGERGVTLGAKAEGSGATGTWRWSQLLTGES